MDYIHKFKKQLAGRLFIAVVVPFLTTLLVWFICKSLLEFEELFCYIIAGSTGFSVVLISTSIISSQVAKPLENISEVITYASNSTRNTTMPTNNSKIAQELTESLSKQIYNLASSAPTNLSPTNQNMSESHEDELHESAQILLDGLPIPVIGINAKQNVTIANSATAQYLAKPLNEIVGKPVYDALHLSFQSEEGLEQWLKQVKENSVTANFTWDRVRHQVDSDNFKQFDLVASFSSGKSNGTETMLAIFDKTERYRTDDEEVSYVALAVHELRTPLTIMRGYIEVFSDELASQLSPELTDFMQKMEASAEQLTAFVSNILNVARIEENQLSLKLREEKISSILKSATDDLDLRARVYGKHIETHIAEDLPTVAVDRISIHEVVNNLVDNSIKYSDKSDKIIVTAKNNNEGLVEISVQDFGFGIPASVMGQLFQKFHRSHRSNVQVGTGLGLYLCKAMVKAHGGNIWVRSKEGEGSVFSFTLIPYNQMSKEQLAGEDGIIRGAHGWIKNHSLYRN